ncbi:hypothetical protein LTR85_007682 [Meristemomyces frigidus]|nr:hypothetical protein LTR85_007682 [Meristemomyces frigidus]
MLVQHILIALAAAAIASAQASYGPPVAYCPPSCTAATNLTFTQNVTDCTATTTRWGRHTNTVTTVTTTTGPPTACPYRLTVTPSSSACPTNITVTTTAPPTACPYQITVTPSSSACPTNITLTTTAPPSACPYRVTETTTITSIQNFTTTLTQNVTVSATSSASATPYTGPYIEILTFATSNCSNAGAEAVGYPPDFDRYVLTIDPATNSSPCTKFTGPLGSMEYNVIGTEYPAACYMNFYSSDLCASDSSSQVLVSQQQDQCWEFANPLSVRAFCASPYARGSFS